MATQTVELRMPDLGLRDVPLTACTWYVEEGDRVVEGDRLLEVLSGEVTIDLPSPASGIICERSVDIDDRLTTGQLLAVIRISSVE